MGFAVVVTPTGEVFNGLPCLGEVLLFPVFEGEEFGGVEGGVEVGVDGDGGFYSGRLGWCWG